MASEQSPRVGQIMGLWSRKVVPYQSVAREQRAQARRDLYAARQEH